MINARECLDIDKYGTEKSNKQVSPHPQTSEMTFALMCNTVQFKIHDSAELTARALIATWGDVPIAGQGSFWFSKSNRIHKGTIDLNWVPSYYH